MEQRIFKVSDFEKEDKDLAVKTIIQSSESSNTVVWVVKPGQSVKCHMHDNADDIWYVLEGTGLFHSEVGKNVEVKQGDVIINKKGQCHGVTNNGNTDFKFLGVLTNSPANYEALE